MEIISYQFGTQRRSTWYAEEYLIGCGWQQVMPAHRWYKLILNSCHSYDAEMDMKRYIVVEIDHEDNTVADVLKRPSRKLMKPNKQSITA